MKNHSSNPRYIILTLTIATLLAFFAMQAGAAYTTVTTPITGTVSTTFSSPDIQILVSSDGNTLSSDAGGDGIYAGSGGAVSIDKMSGGPDSLVINSGSNGVNVDGGTVSSDADLVINSGRNGVNNNGGTVNLAGVSIDAASAASAADIAGINNTGSGSTTISGDQALIRASTSVDGTDAAAIANSGGSVSIKTSGDVLLAAKSNASSRNASSLISNTGSSTVSVDAGGQVTFDVTAQSAKGLDNTAAPDFGTGVTVTAAKGVSYAVTATNGEATGIGASGSGSVIDFGKVNSVAVSATGGDAYGLFTQEEGSRLSGDVQSLTVNSNSNAYGVYANRSGDVQLALSGDMTVNSANSGAYGVYARNGGNVQLAMNGDMAVSSANGQAYGVYAGSNSGSGGNVQLAMNGDMAVSSDNSMAYGVYAGSMIGSGGNVQLAMSGDMAVSSANGQAYGVYAGSSNSGSGGNVQLAMSGDMAVSSDNSMAYGVYADKSGVVSGDAQNLTVNSAIGKAYGIDISSNKVSTINIADDLTVKGAAGGAGIEASGAAHQITVGGLTDVSIASNGDNAIYAADGANVNLNGGVSLDVTGITGDVSGIKANGGNVTVSGSKAIVKASTTGENLTAYAINNTGSGDISINTGDAGVELTASAENGEANAVSNSGTGKVTIATTGQVSFDVTGLTAKGLYYDGTASGVSVDAKGGSSYAVTATNGSAFGVAVSGSGNTLSYGKVNNVVVNATGDYAGVLAAYGFAALSGGTLSGDGTNSIKNVSVTADKDVAGVYADNGSSVMGASIDNLTVNSGRIAFGINVSRNSSADLTVDNLTVNSASNGFGIDVSDNSSADLTVGNMYVNGSNNTYGVYAAISGNVQLALSGDLAVKSASGGAEGVYAGNNGSVKFTGVRNLTVSADNGVGFGLYAINGSVSGDAQSLTVNANSDAIGVEAISSNLQLALSGDMAVNSANRNAYGAYADSGDVQFTGVRNLTVSADNGVGYGLYALGGSVSGNAQSLTVNSKYNAYGVSAGTRSDVQLALSGDLAVNSASGDAYGAYADNGSVKFTGVRNLTVSADNGKGYGLYALGDADNQLLGSVSGDVQSLTVNSYYTAYGVYAETSGDVQLALSGDLAVKSASGGAEGVYAGNNGSVKFTGVRNLTVSADNGVGFGLYAINGSVSGDAQSLTVTSANGNAYGINISSNKVSNINIAKDLTVKGADGGAGIEASGAAHQITVGGLTDVVVAANGYNAVYAADGANVNLNGGASLDVTGTDEVSGIAADGGNVSVSGNKAIVKASTTGDNAKAYAINNTGSGAVTIDTGDAGVELTAKATSGDAAAIGNSGTGSVTVKTRGQASFDVTGLSAKGLSSNSGAGITVSAAGGSNYAVTATSGDAYGLEADNSNLAYGKVNNLTVNATNGNANGLAAMNSGALGSDTAMNGAISATAKGSNYVIANAVYASDISSVKLNGVTGISAVGANAVDAENESDAYAVNAVSSSDVEIAMNGDMKASGSGTTAYADGLFANYSKVSASGVKNLIVSATGTAGDESAWGVDATGGSDVALAMGGDMKVSSTGNAYGVDAYSDSTVSLSGAMAISVTADSGDAYGINAYDRSAVSADAGSLTAVSNKGAAYGINLYTDHVSSIDVTGDLTVRSAAGGTGITAAGAQHQITVGGLTDISIAARGYNAVYAANGANVNLNGGASLDVTGTDEVSGIAADGGNVTISGNKAIVKASTTGENLTAYALNNTGSGDITINTGYEGVELTASSASGAAQAIGNSGTGKVTVTTRGQVSFDVTGLTAKGIYNTTSQGAGVAVSAAGGSNYAVTATNGEAYGIEADGKTSLDYGKVNNVTATATNGDAYGLAATNGATLSGDTNSAIKNITVTENTAGQTAYGILSSNGSTVKAGSIDAISVNSAGAGYGVLVKDSSKFTAKIGAITVNASNDAYGLYAPSSESKLDVSITGPVKVTTENGQAIGVYSASGGVTVSDDQAVITATSKGGDASAITPDSGDITVKETSGVDLTAKTDEGTATGVNVSTGKTVDVTAGGTVSADATGASAYGFKAEKGNTAADSLINIAAGKDITIKATATNGEAAGFYADGDIAKITYKAAGALSISADAANSIAYGFRAENGGVISGDSAGGTVAVKSAGGGANGIEAMSGSNVTVSGVKAMTVSSDAGDAYGVNADNSTANVGTQSMNVYSASSNADGVYANSGDVKLAMNGDLTAASDGGAGTGVYGVEADNNSVVEFSGAKALKASANGGVAFGISAYNGKVSGDLESITASSKLVDADGVRAISGDVKLAMNGDLSATSEKAGAFGIDAWDNSTVVFSGVKTLNASSDQSDATGINANDSVVSGDLDNLNVAAANGAATGIDISSGKVSSIDITNGLTVKGATGGAGITAGGAAHQITVGGLTDVSIASNGDNAIYAADGANVNLNGGVSIDITGTGDVSGIAADVGNVTVSGKKAIVKASTTGDGATAYALNNTGSGDITIINSGDVELTASSVNGAAQAIGNSGTGSVTVTTSGQVSFDVTGLTAKGIYNTTSQGEGVSVSAAGGSNYAITATSGDAYGIAADGVALAYGKVNNVTVTATNGNAYGLLADNSGTLSGDTDTNSAIKSLTVTANTAGYSAYGILASGDNSQANIGTVDKLTVTSSGDAYGVYVKNDGGISGTVSGDLTVTAAGNAYGIYAPDKNSSADITVKGAVTATSAAGEATGVYAAGGGVRLSGPEAVVKATSGANSDAVALYPKSNDITINESGDITLTANSGSGGAAYGAKVPDSRRLDLATEKSVSIDVTGGTNGAYGLYAESGAGSSVITAKAASGAIRISAKTDGGAAYGLVTSGDGASISLSAGTISVDAANGAISANGGSVTVSADSRGSLAATGASAAVIYAANGASIDLTNIDAAAGTSGMLVIGSGDSAITARNSVLSGDIKHSDLTLGGLNKTNVMTLSLLNDTTFTGKANSPRIDINIDDASTWEVTGDSSTYGTLKSAGTVKFVNESRYSTVTTDKLSGKKGSYLMHADLENDTSDKIVSATSGNDDGSKTTGTIEILNGPNSKATAYRARMTGDLIAVTGDKNSSFTLSGGTYTYGIGAWKYALASEDIGGTGLGWYLSNNQTVSNMGTAVLGSVIAPNIGRLEEGALYSQLGSIDYASADRSEARAWGYAIYSKFKYTDAASAPYGGTLPGDYSAENKFYGLTGGMDKLVNATETGSFYAGAMMGYGEGTLDVTGGEADDNSFHAGLYGIYKWTDGLYAAGIIKYNRYRTNVTARPEEGGAYRADYNQDGWSVSALAGKRFDLKNNWYAEPQAELGYQRIGSASYEIGGSDIAIDSTNSVRARLGVAVGRKVTTESGKTLDFYVKASVLREFDGETNISINGDPFKTDFGGTWGQYKLGIDYWNADNFGARAAIVYENGEGYESPIGFELGLNWYTGPKQQKAETEETAPQEETKAETEAPAAKTE